MTVKEYASEMNVSVAEVLKKCAELGIEAKDASDFLEDDDIVMLDNTINLMDFKELTINIFGGDIRSWYYNLVSNHLPKEFLKPIIKV